MAAVVAKRIRQSKFKELKHTLIYLFYNLQVRKTVHQKWHSEAYKQTCYETYDKLNALSVRVMRVICGYLGLNEESFNRLVLNEPPYAVHYEYATSFLEIFHYLDNQQDYDVVPCPDHGTFG